MSLNPCPPCGLYILLGKGQWNKRKMAQDFMKT